MWVYDIICCSVLWRVVKPTDVGKRHKGKIGGIIIIVMIIMQSKAAGRSIAILNSDDNNTNDSNAKQVSQDRRPPWPCYDEMMS